MKIYLKKIIYFGSKNGMMRACTSHCAEYIKMIDSTTVETNFCCFENFCNLSNNLKISKNLYNFYVICTLTFHFFF